MTDPTNPKPKSDFWEQIVDGVTDKLVSDTYLKALEQAKNGLFMARKEREEAIKRQEQLEQKIMDLRRTVAALSSLCGEEFNEDDEFGLTDSIRMALKTYNGILNAQQVKTRLEQLGYKTESTNLLASVHTILRRLVLKGELDDGTIGNDGKPTYKWIGKK